jgi:hypothetical protein
VATIRKINFKAEQIAGGKAVQFGKDWPVVYVLENGTEAYVGESTNASARFRHHIDKVEKRIFSRAYIIGDVEYNKSATLDVESLLIQYMAADGVFKLQNGNAGIVNHQYFEKEKYLAKVESIWDELRRMQLETLMTRGIKGCYVYCVDENLNSIFSKNADE